MFLVLGIAVLSGIYFRRLPAALSWCEVNTAALYLLHNGHMTFTSLRRRICLLLNLNFDLFSLFLPARRYASAGLCDSDVSVCLSVCPSVCPPRAGIVPSRAKAGS